MADKLATALDPAAIDALRSRFRGEVLDATSPAYDATRTVWNGMIDRRPAAIARCRNAGRGGGGELRP